MGRQQAHANPKDGKGNKKRYDTSKSKDRQGTGCGRERGKRTAGRTLIRTEAQRMGFRPSIYKRASVQNRKYKKTLAK